MAADDRAWVEVDLQCISTNVVRVRQFIGANREIMAVVKADGYGHGMAASAQAAVKGGATWLGVATVDEAALLAPLNLKCPICLLCPFAPGQAEIIGQGVVIPTIGDVEQLETLKRHPCKPNLPIHLEIDTGMGRSGSLPQYAVALHRRALELGFLPQGLSTHYSDPIGASDATLNPTQQVMFQQAYQALQAAGAKFPWIHLDASGAIVSLDDDMGNLVRPGLLIYGIQPDTNNPVQQIAPAMSVYARVATVRTLPAGHPISYGGIHRLTRESRLATVLIGYGDGYPRRLSNKGQVILGGHRAHILGAVCMDQIVVDVTDLPYVKPGDVACCLGGPGSDKITANEIAATIATTVHEIPTTLTNRLPRKYVNH